MEKEIKDEFKNERTLSDILGIPAEKEKELTDTKLKIDDLSYIRQTAKEKKKKVFNPHKFIITSIILVIVIIILYLIIF